MHLYAFGSLCRGEIDRDSDIDVLAIVERYDDRLDPKVFSIYSYQRIKQLWDEGNPFAWHLSLEARLVFADDENDHLRSLGPPQRYRHASRDCLRFLALLREARLSLGATDKTIVFDLSAAFLALRNFASCYALGTGNPDFSRHAALRLGGVSAPMAPEAYRVLERARILCTRGQGAALRADQIAVASGELRNIERWMTDLIEAKP